MEKFYLTTAIAYTSQKPHIGNVYETILADAIVRYKKLEGYDCYFQTGTDEHGQKIEDKARERGIEPKQYVDEIALGIKAIYDDLGICYDRFIRTTDNDHEKIVQRIFNKLHDKNDIYKGQYEGSYCVPCESFFTKTQLVDGKCPDCGRDVVQAKEEAYFLKLEKYQQRLIKHIEEYPDFIQPESRKNEMLNNFLKDPLPDLCVSRSSFTWGIPVEFDKKHVTYVWLDALSNYITGLGYNPDGESGELFKKYWPADIHLIGKDILRFHTIYWPIILMALDIPLPKQVFGHPWILGEGGVKMSKSLGNVVYTEDLIKYFGVDCTRYYCLHDIPFAQDGSISMNLVLERNNKDLANTYGNLVNRTVSMSQKYFNGIIKKTDVNDALDNELIDMASSLKAKVSKLMDDLHVNDAIEEIFAVLRRGNKYVDETEPWILGRSEDKLPRLSQVLYNLLETIRICSILLQAFIPTSAKKVLDQINAKEISFGSIDDFGKLTEFSCNKAEPIFLRVDSKELNEKIKANEEKKERTDLIDIKDFENVNLVVGEIVECKKHPDASKLLVSKINLGKETRQIVSGIANYYSPEQMVGKKVVVVENLKPVNIRGVLSEGMILAGSNKKALEVLSLTSLNPGDKIK